MAQVLSQEGLGDILGQQLGQGFAQGAQQGISSYLNNMMQKKKEFASIDEAIRKSYGKDWEFLDDDERIKGVAYCDICKAYLCKECTGDWIRRGKAALMNWVKKWTVSLLQQPTIPMRLQQLMP